MAPLRGFMAAAIPPWRTPGLTGMNVRRSFYVGGTRRRGSCATWSPPYGRPRPSRMSWHPDITPPKQDWINSWRTPRHDIGM